MIHYIGFTGQAIVFSAVAQETLRFACFYLVCYFFCSKATLILPSNKQWLNFLRIFLIFNLCWISGATIFLEAKIGIMNTKQTELCTTPMFIILRASGEFVTLVFFIIGILITWKVKNAERDTIYEQTKQQHA
jgi:hypothetical protein